jgi:hypothetical protein
MATINWENMICYIDDFHCSLHSGDIDGVNEALTEIRKLEERGVAEIIQRKNNVLDWADTFSQTNPRFYGEEFLEDWIRYEIVEIKNIKYVMARFEKFEDDLLDDEDYIALVKENLEEVS